MAPRDAAPTLPALSPDLEIRLRRELQAMSQTAEMIDQAARAGLHVQHLVSRCTGCQADLQRFLDVYFPNRSIAANPLPPAP